IHNILYELKDLNILNLNTLLVTTINNFIKLYSTPQKELSITYHGEDTNIDADIFVHIGMLINELITNSCKHNIVSGTSINVNIQLKKTGLNSLQITYADNSGGYNLQKFKNPNTMGLLIIKNIVQNQLKGEINVENTFGGCTYTIIFNY
ncbi:MAG: sensor histidine kinase, partial [Bacteroidia bacterium]|nr:sensor histidine kinase [Bacteroidia bacterium]